eukprot:5996575-Prymnesium_polylepis.2
MRACAHDYAERLGLLHKSVAQGEGKAVRVSIPPAPVAAAAAATASSSEAGAAAATTADGGADAGANPKKRKAPDGGAGRAPKPSKEEIEAARAKKKHCAPRVPHVPGGGHRAERATRAPPGWSHVAGGVTCRVYRVSRVSRASVSRAGVAQAASGEPRRRGLSVAFCRAADSSRLGKCAKANDAIEGMRVFNEMEVRPNMARPNMAHRPPQYGTQSGMRVFDEMEARA